MKVPFSKVSGCGNDFILLDQCDCSSPPGSEWMVRICDRRHGIGADGVIWLNQASEHSAQVHIYNADGSEAEACGNAFRCILAYLKEKKPHQTPFTIQTPFTSAKVKWEEALICTELQEPQKIEWDISLSCKGENWYGHFVDIGVPHGVFFVPDVETIDVPKIGKALRYHDYFGSRGANINFAFFRGNRVHYRTYERGVEAETLACGTGAAAIALATFHAYGANPPLTLVTLSGEELLVDFSTVSPLKFFHLSLSGPATLVYEGTIDLGNHHARKK